MIAIFNMINGISKTMSLSYYKKFDFIVDPDKRVIFIFQRQ